MQIGQISKQVRYEARETLEDELSASTILDFSEYLVDKEWKRVCMELSIHYMRNLYL